MKHFIFTLIILANCTTLLAQSTESVTHKQRLIEFVNSGDFNKASEEIGHVENWEFDDANKKDYLNINKSLKFYEYIDSIQIDSVALDSFLIYISKECDVFFAHYYENRDYENAIYPVEIICNIYKSVYGKQHPEYAVCLNNLGTLYHETRDYSKAETYYLQALETKKSILGEQHPDYATLLNSLGILYSDMGDYSKAETFYLQALEIRKSVLGEQHFDYATTLNNLGNLYYVMGDYSKAETYYLQALEIRKSVLGEQHPDFARSFNHLGILYYDMGDYSKAEPYFLQALEIRKSVLGEQHPDYAESLNNLGALYSDMGDYTKAETYYLQALEINKSILGEQHPNYATSLNNLGHLYSYIGDYSKAEIYYLQSSQIRKTVLGEQHPDYATSLHNLGAFYRSMGDYSKAETYYLQALEIFKSFFGEKHPNYASSLNNLGSLYSDMGDYSKAAAFYLQALKIRKTVLGEQHLDYATSLYSLGILFKNLGDYSKAETYYLQALEVYKSVYGEQHPDYAALLNSLGVLYTSMGDYSKAETYHKQALEICKSILGEQHLNYANSLTSLGVLYYHMGDYSKAEPYFLQALEIRKSIFGEQHPDYAISLNNLGGSYSDMGDYSKAETYFLQASQLMKNMFLSSLDFMTEQERQHYWKTMQTIFSSVYPSFSYLCYAKLPSISTFAYDNELFTKGLLLNSSNAITQSIQSSGDTALINQFNQLKSTKQIILHLQEKEPQSAHLAEYIEQAEILEKEITKSSVAYRENLRQWSITWDSVRAALKPNQVAIEFMSAPLNEDSTMYCALLLRHNSQHPELITLFNEKEVASLLPATTDNAEKINNTYLFNRNGWKLSELIWTNLKPYLNTKDVVFFAPTGILHRIAIENLPYDADRSMTEVYNLVRLSSTRELVLNKPAIPNRKASLYGGINYFPLDSAIMISNAEKYRGVGRYTESSSHVATDTVTRSIAYNLPGSKKEIEEVKPILDKMQVSVTVYSQDTACEESFKALSGTRQNILLLSTHGFFWQDAAAQKERFFSQRMTTMSDDHYTVKIDPLDRCGLLFSGANTALSGHQERLPQGVDDGILTAKEISTMDFRDADIVVLSACETGLGDISGEGVFGLQRAFKMAGAQTILMTLWQVHDDATRLFMTSFFTNLGKGLTKREAFHNAQREVRNYTVTKEQTVQSTSAKEKMHNKTAINTVTAMETVTTQPYQSPYYWAGFILLD